MFSSIGKRVLLATIRTKSNFFEFALLLRVKGMVRSVPREDVSLRLVPHLAPFKIETSGDAECGRGTDDDRIFETKVSDNHSWYRFDIFVV